MRPEEKEKVEEVIESVSRDNKAIIVPVPLGSETVEYHTLTDGGGPRRTEEQRERDLVLIADMYLRNKPVSEIALALNDRYEGNVMSRRTVYSDIAELHQRWVRSSLVNFDEHRAKELARIDKLEAAYWEGWDASRQDRITRESIHAKDEIAVGDGQTAPISRSSDRKKVEKRDGDERWLAGIQKCIDMRCKVLGLFSPERFVVDWKVEAKRSGLQEETIDQLYGRMVDEYIEAMKVGEGDGENA